MKGRGPLVTVEIAPGRYAKMHRKDAAKRVVFKRADVGENKRLKPDGGKPHPRPLSARGEGGGEHADDLTQVAGIGAAAATTLGEMGITTFEQLREADLSAMPTRIRKAVEVWRG